MNTILVRQRNGTLILTQIAVGPETVIRTLPRYQVVELLRDSGVSQTKIAKRIRVTQGYVSKVIGGEGPRRPTRKSEAVWRHVERAIRPMLIGAHAGAITPLTSRAALPAAPLAVDPASLSIQELAKVTRQ